MLEIVPPYKWLPATKLAVAPKTVADGGVLSFPNPFNSSTQIVYEVAEEGEVTLVVFNVMGQVVRVLMQEYQLPGYYRIEWNSRDDRGMPVSSGVYFYRYATRTEVRTGRMLLLR